MSHAAPYIEAIEGLKAELARLAAQRAELRRAIGSDPKVASDLLPKMSAIGSEERAMREQLDMLEEELLKAQRRDEADEFAEYRAGVQATADEAVQLANDRVQAIGKKLDKAFADIAALLQQAEEAGAQVFDRVLKVARGTAKGHSTSRLGDRVDAARGEAMGHASNALLHALVASGIGRRGIPADIMINGTVHAETFADAFAKAASRVENRLADWIHQAASVDGTEPAMKRVKATREGYDGLVLRKPGDVFFMPEHSQGAWFEETTDQGNMAPAAAVPKPTDGNGQPLPRGTEIVDGLNVTKGTSEPSRDKPMALSQLDPDRVAR